MANSKKFVTLTVELLNGVPDPLRFEHNWLRKKTFSNLKGLLSALGYKKEDVEEYQHGGALVAILRGAEIMGNLSGKIFVRDAAGKKYMVTVSKNSFMFNGALMFDEYKAVALKYASVDNFNFRKCAFSNEQFEELYAILLSKPPGLFADFRFNTVSEETVAKFKAAGWEKVLHLN